MASWFSGIEAAMSGAAAGAVQSQSEWAALKAQAGAGMLRMEPGVAEACVKACEVAHASLRDEVNDGRRLSRIEGLGSWPSGEAIAQKFRDKAGVEMASDNSALGVIKLHQSVLLEMRDTFRAAGQAYVTAEQANVDRLPGSS